MRHRLYRDNVPAARNLRKILTSSEEILWERLRARQFYGLKFRRQHPIGGFVLDFFCQEMMFGVEIDGGIHRDPDVAARDRDREAALREQHVFVYRWSAEDVERDVGLVLTQLAKELGIHPEPV